MITARCRRASGTQNPAYEGRSTMKASGEIPAPSPFLVAERLRASGRLHRAPFLCSNRFCSNWFSDLLSKYTRVCGRKRSYLKKFFPIAPGITKNDSPLTAKDGGFSSVFLVDFHPSVQMSTAFRAKSVSPSVNLPIR